MAEFTCVFKASTTISGPCAKGDKVYVCSENGNVLQMKGDTLVKKYPTGGCPSDVTVDSDDTLFICDIANQSILAFEGSEVMNIVDNYEESPLLGPNAGVVDLNGVLYFTDGGDSGDSSLASPQGSLFSISGKERLLHPLLHRCLAQPSGVAVFGEGAKQVLYVAETFANRILRGVQNSAGVFQFCVFHQFTGKQGPTGLAVDFAGNLYVARQDFGGPSPAGCVTILNKEGGLVGEVAAPGPEVNGICLGPPSNPYLFITERTTKSLWQFPVESLPI